MGAITKTASHRLPSTPLTIKVPLPHNTMVVISHAIIFILRYTRRYDPPLFLEIFIKAVFRDLSVDIVLIGTYRNDVAQSSI